MQPWQLIDRHICHNSDGTVRCCVIIIAVTGAHTHSNNRHKLPITVLIHRSGKSHKSIQQFVIQHQSRILLHLHVQSRHHKNGKVFRNAIRTVVISIAELLVQQWVETHVALIELTFAISCCWLPTEATSPLLYIQVCTATGHTQPSRIITDYRLSQENEVEFPLIKCIQRYVLIILVLVWLNRCTFDKDMREKTIFTFSFPWH